MKNNRRFFFELRNYMLIFTFFSLWVSTYFKEETENILAYILILSLGILHGTNDIKLIRKESSDKNRGTSKKILYFYLLFIITGILFFYYIPSMALLIFILFSAFHFGEQHWISRLTKKSIAIKFIYIAYGITILGLLFLNNNLEVSEVINNIAGTYISKDVYVYATIFSFLVLVIISIRLIANKIIKVNIWEELFYLLLFYIIFQTASLLWAFAIYFIFWHSIPSLADQVYFLYGNYKKENFIKYLKSSFLHWIISIVGLAMLFLIFGNQDRLFLSIFFTSIAAITFPHVWIMAKLNK
ncbi:Brp/Blh family beta-carotene 15,15'-dioxygenase [uncultured Aquimarina sp.]|uniref:Brp/Blh family beta-carotene 15,15'-dioxygenase n=1 Tax=uncultured Aquimarina sp. TaxID=575652 RepID=UPI0026178EA0|nr:Brp/Blh family beta-carotene 15,15'-dioxygenase [uncultured Aquimarina sp.]